MEARPKRFVGHFYLTSSNNLKIRQLIEGSLKNFNELFESEKKNAPKYARSWAKAEEIYNAKFENDLNEKQKKFITEDLPSLLPDELRNRPTYLPIAVTAYTMKDADFMQRFNPATRKLLSEQGSWDSYRFKSFFILLHFALKFLPSRPSPNMNKVVFRGLQVNSVPEVGSVITPGRFVSFTPKRQLALGKQPMSKKPSDDNKTDDEAQDAVQSSAGVKTHKVLLRANFGPNMRALGVRHLSPFGGTEVEILVSPMQKFQVKKINVKKDKGLTVVVVEPVK